MNDLMTANYGTVSKLNYDLAVLPWGATEPHNLHLPYLTDCILSHDVALDAAKEALKIANVRCMVMYPISMGSQNPGQWNQKFCIHTRYETQKAILTDIVDSLSRQGIFKMVIINGHGGNTFKAMIRDLSVTYPQFRIAVADWFGIVPQEDYFEMKDDHAGELETSVMLHYHSDWVDLSQAGDGASQPFALSSLREKTAWIPRNWTKATKDTGIGDPRKATAEKGERYAKSVVAKLTTLFVELSQNEW
ncbi:MAG: creatininase family protein [Muribaculaceae bacterium]